MTTTSFLRNTFLLSITALFLFFAVPMQAASWTEYATDGLQTVSGFYVNGDIMTLAGNSGELRQSDDGGSTWSSAVTFTSEWFQSLDGFDDVRVATGGRGVIARSSDGGISWSPIPIVNMENFEDVFFASSTDGAIVGTNGTYYYSLDGGLGWISVNTGYATKQFRAVAIQNGVTWLAGDNGFLLSTPDRGATWEQLPSSTTKRINDIAWLSNDVGYLVGEDGVIQKTVNAGVDWEAVSVSGLDEQHLQFITIDGEKILIGGVGIVLVSTDAGAAFDVHTFADETLNTGAIDEGNFWVAGSKNSVGTLYFLDGIIPSQPQNLATSTSLPTKETELVFTWDASTDTGSGMSHYLVTLNDAPAENIGNITTYTASDLVSGMHTLTVQAVDQAGNLSEIANKTFEILVDDVQSTEPNAGTLIKLACEEGADVNDPCKAVYYYGSDGARHAFPNEKVYFSWYDNFDGVVTVEQDFLSSLPLGRNITYRPGYKMVKFQSLRTVYVVDAGGVLRAIDSEDTARTLYGDDWNTKIDDISDAFFSSYHYGEDLTAESEYNATQIHDQIQTIDQDLAS